MSIPFKRHIPAFGLLVLSVGYAVFVLWQEWQFRQQLPRLSEVARPATVVSEPATLDATAVAMVLGFTSTDTPQASAEPLTLHASFVASDGLSKALLADAQGPRLYQVGERLPGGSVLRRVETNQVLLWNKGREERLTLHAPAARFLRQLETAADAQAPGVTTRFLRPFSGLSE
ncbi:type II secretion system protein N [Pseudomonas sp. REP124]|uniref:type II secretion system protein N n=1 Tax=Pseudomonas sp. REP124 TaxID=2875731 RepID=UPI0029623EB0|nr:type II secretion system protein N [Pseudomonas sp. REP124]